MEHKPNPSSNTHTCTDIILRPSSLAYTYDQNVSKNVDAYEIAYRFRKTYYFINAIIFHILDALIHFYVCNIFKSVYLISLMHYAFSWNFPINWHHHHLVENFGLLVSVLVVNSVSLSQRQRQQQRQSLYIRNTNGFERIILMIS